MNKSKVRSSRDAAYLQFGIVNNAPDAILFADTVFFGLNAFTS